jgi:hypothetical protein
MGGRSGPATIFSLLLFLFPPSAFVQKQCHQCDAMNLLKICLRIRIGLELSPGRQHRPAKWRSRAAAFTVTPTLTNIITFFITSFLSSRFLSDPWALCFQFTMILLFTRKIFIQQVLFIGVPRKECSSVKGAFQLEIAS